MATKSTDTDIVDLLLTATEVQMLMVLCGAVHVLQAVYQYMITKLYNIKKTHR